MPKESKWDEKLLLYRLQSEHDPESFVALYDRYVAQIYRFVFFKVKGKEEAEDITSDVFLKAWQYCQENREIGSFSGLLYRIARNCVIDMYRRTAARPESVVIEEEFEVVDTTDHQKVVEDKMDAASILESLHKLKQEYQEVLTLRFIDGLEIEEIATIIGKGNINVRVLIHRALRRLKEISESQK
jgi:RNA polymerase sigma-70 factor (ECF subfamily)